MANTEIIQAIETGTKVVDTSVVIKNKSLKSQTDAIRKLMYQMKANLFEIAVRMKKIQDGKLYEADGFADVQDYAEQVFGYKKSMTYNLLRVAENFILQDGRQFKSIVAHDNNDYTVSQLQEVLVIEPTEVITLDANSVISPDMTTKEIRAKVKQYRNGAIDDKGNKLESDTEDEASEDSATIPVEINDEDLANLLQVIKDVQSSLEALEDNFDVSTECHNGAKAVLKFCAEWCNDHSKAVITAKNAE